MPQDSLYTVDNNPNASAVLTADYVQGVQVAFLTSPGGLHLTVDGDANYTSYDFIWGLGTTHQVVAAATQTGTNGRVYTFQNWSNQAAASQSITVSPGMAAGYRLTANFNELSRVVVQSSAFWSDIAGGRRQLRYALQRGPPKPALRSR